jgi:NAD(P)-dependent dehydrogenase (short-subunit alcohol dehydrogenase family)
VTKADYDRALSINLKGVFFTTQAMVQHLMASIQKNYRFVTLPIKQRTRSILGFRCFDSAARFCAAHDEVHHFLRFQPVGQRSAPLSWQRRIRHHQFTLLREMMLAA